MGVDFLSDPLSLKLDVSQGVLRPIAVITSHRMSFRRPRGRIGQIYGYLIRSGNGPRLSVTENRVVWNGLEYDLENFHADVIGGLQGAFASIVEIGKEFRLYTDASSQIPIVYDATRRVVGCSANDIFSDEDYDRALRRDRVSKLVVREGKAAGYQEL